MSQQHMDFDQPRSTDEQAASYTTGYQQEQGLYFDQFTANSQGQKLSQHGGSTGPTSGQRLALAIVSLSLFVFAFTFALVIVLVMPSDRIVPLAPAIGWIGVWFAILLIVINTIFNRKH